jgi:hypothetical protein
MKWTPDLDKNLKSLWNSGYTCEKIAKIINIRHGVRISKNSVIGRAHRTHLRPRRGGIETVEAYDQRLEAWNVKNTEIKTPTLDAWASEPHHLSKAGGAIKSPQKAKAGVEGSKPVHDRPSKLKTLGDGSKFIYRLNNPRLYGL